MAENQVFCLTQTNLYFNERRVLVGDQTSVEGAGLQCRACTQPTIWPNSRAAAAPDLSAPQCNLSTYGWICVCWKRGLWRRSREKVYATIQLIKSLSHPFQLRQRLVELQCLIYNASSFWVSLASWSVERKTWLWSGDKEEFTTSWSWEIQWQLRM